MGERVELVKVRVNWQERILPAVVTADNLSLARLMLGLRATTAEDVWPQIVRAKDKLPLHECGRIAEDESFTLVWPQDVTVRPVEAIWGKGFPMKESNEDVYDSDRLCVSGTSFFQCYSYFLYECHEKIVRKERHVHTNVGGPCCLPHGTQKTVEAIRIESLEPLGPEQAKMEVELAFELCSVPVWKKRCRLGEMVPFKLTPGSYGDFHVLHETLELHGLEQFNVTAKPVLDTLERVSPLEGVLVKVSLVGPGLRMFCF